jgi:prepilin-type N-terminal cleavage/methylation domain-containing protein
MEGNAMRKMKKSMHAFTLVELLVVISIIAMLLAVLLPSLSRAREQARQIVCMSDTKQLGLASASYVSSTGYLPVYGVWKGDGSPGLMYASNDPIIGSTYPSTFPPVSNWMDNGCFGTPASALIRNKDLKDQTGIIGACPTSKPYARISFGYNYANLGSSSVTSGNVIKDGKEWVKITKVQMPGKTGMFCDGVTGKDKLITGGYGIHFWEPSMWPDYTGKPTQYSATPILGHQKGTKININYVDGHTAAMAPKMLHLKRSQTYRLDDEGDWIWRRVKNLPGDKQRTGNE